MESIRDYLLSVTAAALICGIIGTLTGKTSNISKVLKLLCGLFLAATVIKPLINMKVDNIYSFTESLTVSSDLAVMQGEKIASDEMKRIIKEKTEAYILDKANALGAQVAVEIVLEEYVPVGVTVRGDISPYVRSNLADSITRELNIPAEEQIWKRY